MPKFLSTEQRKAIFAAIDERDRIRRETIRHTKKLDEILDDSHDAEMANR